MKASHAAVAVVVIIVVVLAFFLLPIFTITSSKSYVFGAAHVTYTAQVSASFALFNCGWVMNPTATSSVLGYTTGQSIAPTGFYCVIYPKTNST